MKHAIFIEDEIEYQIHVAEALNLENDNWSISNFTLGKDGINFFKQLKRKPNIALVDIGLPDISGIEVIREFKIHQPGMPILVYSALPNENVILQAMIAGACGYIIKDDSVIAIKTAIEEAISGNTPISPCIAKHLLSFLPISESPKDGAPILSTQERRLLEHIAAGQSYAVAADCMELKLSTVHGYSRNLFRKLCVTSKTQALFRARSLGLLP